MKISETEFPSLYRSSDNASLSAQSRYFSALRLYLLLLICAAFVSYNWPKHEYGAMASALLFLVTLVILIWLKLKKPEDEWYNGRAVAESVKTRTWRWMMKAEPYNKDITEDQAQREFLSDLKAILGQNRSISELLHCSPDISEAISNKMISVRSLSWEKRLDFYKSERIDNQRLWYSKKSQLNKRRSKQWFILSVIIHLIAIALLIFRISKPETALPIEVFATAAGAILTWVQAKKHNELMSSYSLAAHEILLIKGESVSVKSEEQLSEFVVNSEAAFSREHTQWIARKSI